LFFTHVINEGLTFKMGNLVEVLGWLLFFRLIIWVFRQIGARNSSMIKDVCLSVVLEPLKGTEL